MSILHQIVIKKECENVVFDPSTLNASVGDQIFWTNEDEQTHWPGLPDNDSFFMPNQIVPSSQSPIFSPGGADTCDYVCSLHPGATGKIVGS